MANLIQIKRSLNTGTTPTLANGELAYTANGDILFIGSNGATVAIGGKRVPGTLTANQALIANSTSGIDKVIVANLQPISIYANGSLGSSGQVLVSDGANVYWGTGTSGSNTQVQFNDSGVANASAGFTFDKTSNTLTVSNTLSTAFVLATNTVNAAVLSIGTLFKANSSQVTIDPAVALSANGTLGTANQVLRTTGTGIYWADDNGDISAITAGNGLTGGGTSGDISLSVDGANGISVDSSGVNVLAGTDGGLSVNSTGVWVEAGSGLVTNSTGLHVGQANGLVVQADSIRVQQANGITVDSGGVSVSGGSTLTVNATGVHVNSTLSLATLTTSSDININGNTKLGDSSSDIVSFVGRVNTNIVPSSNITYDLGTNLLRWNNVYSDHIESVSGEFTGTLTVGGDLVVTGNVTTVNVSSLSVSDPLIKLAVNNTISDLLYIGFTGHYNGSGNTTNHAGLIRNPTDKHFYMFSTYGNETDIDNNTVNTADPSFTLANLNVYLLSGGLVTNSTHVAITANSTVNVAIVANSITLSTPLAATSGGTGLNSYTSGDILVANTGNVLSKLTLGSDGYVLQSNGTAVVYATLDGGTF